MALEWGGTNANWVCGTYNTVSKIDAAIMDVNAPCAMSWVANTIYTYDISSTVQALTIWDTLNFGNMATKSTWTCPAAGLWHIASTFSFSMNTNDQPCSFQLYHNGAEVWYFTAWYNIATAGEGYHHTMPIYLPKSSCW